MTEDSSKKMLAFFAGVVSASVIMGLFLYFVVVNYNTQINALNAEITELKSQINNKLSEEGLNEFATDNETANWKTYTNTTYGFQIKYPATWSVNENLDFYSNNDDKPVVSLSSPETTAAFRAANGQEVYPDDIAIFYYDSVADETENKANNFGATDIQTLISTNNAISKIGSVTLGGIAATDVYWSGFDKYYVILMEKDKHLFKFWFNNINDKGDLSSTENKILSSFQFIN